MAAQLLLQLLHRKYQNLITEDLSLGRNYTIYCSHGDTTNTEDILARKCIAGNQNTAVVTLYLPADTKL
jgi:hypothetical protein